MDAQSGGKSVVKTTIGYNDPSSTTATGQVRTWKSGATTYTYAYDARGNITSVSDGQSTTTYAYDSFDQLVRENNQAAGKTWTYAYDDGGNIQSKTEYFYVKNAQGDVTGLVSASGTRVVTYTYDAWGNLLATTGSLAATLGEQNPLRYRGYVYDTETGLYYLQSRYYNPGWGRFINVDSLIDNRGVHTQNVFAYCGNNPVNHVDSDGHSALAIVGIVCAGALIAAASYLFVKTVTSRDFQNSWKAAVNSAICSVNGAIDRIQEKIKKSFERARAVPSYKRYEEDHHIVAQKAKTAEPARRILEKVGIDYYNDEVNHVMLKTG